MHRNPEDLEKMEAIKNMLLKTVFISAFIAVVFGQESINVHEGMNVGMHAGVALVICFGILASCAIGINLVTRFCAKRLTH